MRKRPHANPNREALATLGWCCVAAAAIIAGNALLPSLPTGAPSDYYTACAHSLLGEVGPFWLPLGLANSPQNGTVVARSYFAPWSVGEQNGSGDGLNLVGGTATNSSVWGGFIDVNATVVSLHNVTRFGTSPDTPCRSSYGVTLDATREGAFIGYIFNVPGSQLFNASVSDSGEPTSYEFWVGPGGGSSSFQNGFTSANAPAISTCGGAEVSRSVSSTHLRTWLSVPVGHGLRSVAVSLPLNETFQYSFPADTGTWEVDNLSAAQGPGGGWAFAFSPCV